MTHSNLQFVDFSANGEDARYTLGCVMRAIHGYDAKAPPAARVAVGFPLMREAFVDQRGKQLKPPSSGETIRVFGTPESLGMFVASAIPEKLVRIGAAIRTTPAPIPAGAGQARFVRDRTFEKGFKNSSHARRQMSRAAAQNREYTPRSSAKESRGFSFETTSQSSMQEFFLDIRKDAAESCEVLSNVTSYGLCGPGSSVPVF